nr:hypothetical protein L484_012905 [Ipomoea batatas]
MDQRLVECVEFQYFSISSALLPGILPAISDHLSPTKLYILTIRASSSTEKTSLFESWLVTSTSGLSTQASPQVLELSKSAMEVKLGGVCRSEFLKKIEQIQGSPNNVRNANSLSCTTAHYI